MGKHIVLLEDLHTRLDVFRAQNKLKSFNNAVEKLLDAYEEKEKKKEVTSE